MSLKDWIANADFERPIALTPPLKRQGKGPRAYGLPALLIEPSRLGTWVGSRSTGASVNCDDAHLSIHGSGTHTECVAHVSDLPVTIAQVAPLGMLRAMIVTVEPTLRPSGDAYVTAESMEAALAALCDRTIDALIVRTLHTQDQALQNWSGSNPPWFDRDAILAVVKRGILHLVTDLPSVDQEEDGGLLAAHRAFFGLWPKSTPDRPEKATITEMAWIPAELPDGFGVLRLDTLSWPSDAAPSRPVFYPLVSE